MGVANTVIVDGPHQKQDNANDDQNWCSFQVFSLPLFLAHEEAKEQDHSCIQRDICGYLHNHEIEIQVRIWNGGYCCSCSIYGQNQGDHRNGCDASRHSHAKAASLPGLQLFAHIHAIRQVFLFPKRNLLRLRLPLLRSFEHIFIFSLLVILDRFEFSGFRLVFLRPLHFTFLKYL